MQSSPLQPYFCPITKKPMRNPVVIADGFSYERTAIEAWLKNNNTSPVTGKKLAHKHIMLNNALQQLIQHNQKNLTIQQHQQVSDSNHHQQIAAPKASELHAWMNPQHRESPQELINAANDLKDTLQQCINPDDVQHKQKPHYDPNAAANFTATVLRALRKEYYSDLCQSPENHGIPQSFIPFIQSIVEQHKVLKNKNVLAQYSHNIEKSLRDTGRSPHLNDEQPVKHHLVIDTASGEDNKTAAHYNNLNENSQEQKEDSVDIISADAPTAYI